MKTRILWALSIWVIAIPSGVLFLVETSTGTSHWEFIGAPLGNTSLRNIVVDPENDDLWFVGSQGNGLYATRDGGITWEQHISGNVGAIVIHPDNHNIVYASSGSHLYRSGNQGVTWNLVFSFPDPIPGSPLDSPTFIDSILVSAIDGTLVIGLSSQLHSARIYKSSDGGTTWQISFESGTGFHFWDLAEVAVNGFWFFCTEDSSHTDNAIVMRSKDRGQSWEEMVPLRGTPWAGHGLNLEVHPESQVVYFLTESSFLSSSADFGDSWSAFRDVDFRSVLLIDGNRPNRFFGGELVTGLMVGGVYLSEDTGETFNFIGLSGKSIASLAVTGTSTKLLALVSGDGIYVSPPSVPKPPILKVP